MKKVLLFGLCILFLVVITLGVPSPIHYFPFDQNSTDLGSSRNDVEWANGGGTEFYTGIVGNSVGLNDNANHYATNDTLVDVASIRTIEMFVRRNSTNSGDSPLCIRDPDEPSGQYNDRFNFELSSSGFLFVLFKINNSVKVDWRCDISGNQYQDDWMHVVMLMNPLEIHINGTNQTSGCTKTVNTDPNVHLHNGQDQLVIGELAPGFGNAFDGYIDNIAMFNNRFNHTEIANAWNNGTGRSYGAGGDSSPPIINVTYPTSDAYSNGSVQGNCLDAESNVTFMYLNDTNFDDLRINDTIFNFDYTGTSDNITILLTCNDSVGNSATKEINLTIDSGVPQCNVNPDTFTVSTDYTWDNNCTDDINLYSLNVSCDNGFSFNISNINNTFYTFSESISSNSTGTITCTFDTADAHTDNDISDRLNEFTTKYEKGALSVPGHYNIITPLNNSGNVDSFDLDFKKDRVKFKVKYDIFAGTPRDHNFMVEGQSRVDFIDSPLYPGWLVIDHKYWIDFDSDVVTNVSVTKINHTNVVVTVRSSEKNINFNSIGILNTNSQDQILTVSAVDTSLQFGQACPTTIVSTYFTIFAIVLSFILVFIGLMWIDFVGGFGAIGLIVSSAYIVGCMPFFALMLALLGAYLLVQFYVVRSKD